MHLQMLFHVGISACSCNLSISLLFGRNVLKPLATCSIIAVNWAPDGPFLDLKS